MEAPHHKYCKCPDCELFAQMQAHFGTNEPEPNTRAGEAFDPPCTDCGDTGVTFQTERACTCDAATRPLPQPSELGTAWQSAVEETDRLERELDLTNVDHVALWLEANAISPPLTHQLGWVACRITEAYEAQIAKLQADGDKLAGALRGLVDSFEKHRPKQLWDNARQALTEWKDPKNA